MAIAMQKKSDSRFPELAVARKGGKKQQREKNGKKYEVFGPDLNYFRMDFHDDPFSQAAKFAFFQSYTKEPNNLRIYLPFHQVERQWSAYYEGYRNGAMVLRAGTIQGEDPEIDYYITAIDSNGKRVVTNGYNLEGQRVKFDPENVIITQKNREPVKVKPVGRLYFVVPETIVSDVLGCVLLRTHSYNDILNITSQLNALAEMTDNRISAVPLHLLRRDQLVPVKQDDGSIIRSTKSLVNVIANTAWAREFLTHKLGTGSEMANPNLLPHLSVLAVDDPSIEPILEPGEVIESIEGEPVFSDDEEDEARDFDAEVANVNISRTDARKMILDGNPASEMPEDDLRLFAENMRNLFINDEFENPDQERAAIVKTAAAYLVLQDKVRSR